MVTPRQTAVPAPRQGVRALHLPSARPSLQARIGALTVLALLASLFQLFGATPAAEASIDATKEADFIALVNIERAAEGLPALTPRSDIRTVARDHSVRMARESRLYHNPNFSTEITNWKTVAENVGRGPSVESIHGAFMRSPGHRANIMHPDLTEIGVGVEVRDGQVWVTQNFRRPKGTITLESVSTAEFGDVSSTSVHVTGILAVTSAGITQPCGVARFCPSDSVTRADFVEMLGRSMGVSPASSSRFTDMTGTAAGYAETLAADGVVSGTSATTFSPDRLLSREQLGSMFAKALDLTPEPSPFSDVTSTHAENVGAIAARGIVKGCGGDLFCPRDQVTRAQVATMLTNEFG